MAVQAKKITKASKRRLMIFGSLSCLIMIYCLFNFITYSYKIKKLSDEHQTLTEELTNLKERESNLKNEINRLKDPDYLARYARENYLYTKNGEYVIKMDKEKQEIEKKDEKNIFKEYKGYILAASILLGVMVLYILKTLVKEDKKKK